MHKSLYIKRPQVKTVPYCIYMITFMHKSLYIKRPQVKTVPYCIYTITFFMHKPLYIKRPQIKTAPYCIYMITFMLKPLYIKDPKLNPYRAAITPLVSKQYSTYAVAIVSFSCLPREAPVLREIRTLRQVAHKVARMYLHYGFYAPRQYGTGDIF